MCKSTYYLFYKGHLKSGKNCIFDVMNFSSKLIEEAVNEFNKLPGVGKRTALRFVLHLMKLNKNEVEQFGNAFIKLRSELRYCEKCHNVSDKVLCEVCANPHRDHSTVCIVEDI